MFLDDKLYKIGASKGVNPKHWQDKTDIINEMAKACHGYVMSNIVDLETTKKRLFAHWNNAVSKLHRDGYIFIPAEMPEIF